MRKIQMLKNSKQTQKLLKKLLKNPTKDEKLHNELSWGLIEHKIRYYLLSSPIVSDSAYDELEIKYLKLCDRLGRPNTIVHKSYPGYEHLGTGMMEVDLNRPSVNIAYQKLLREHQASDRVVPKKTRKKKA